MNGNRRTVMGVESTSGPQPTTCTPSGFKNLRVLIPEDLHWRLRNLANQSRMSFHRFIVAWLSEAFPLNPAPGTPDTGESPGSDSEQTGDLGPGPSPCDSLNPTVTPKEQPQGHARPEHGSFPSGLGSGEEPVASAGANPHA